MRASGGQHPRFASLASPSGAAPAPAILPAFVAQDRSAPSQLITFFLWRQRKRSLSGLPLVPALGWGKMRPFVREEARHDQGTASQCLSLPRFGGDAEILPGFPRPAARQCVRDQRDDDRPDDPRAAQLLSAR